MAGKKTIGQWIKLIRDKDTDFITRLESIYGKDSSLIQDRLDAFLNVAARFGEIYGMDRHASLIRAPGRLNIMGMHVDHRGAFVNPIAINREVLLCYAERDDATVQIHDLNPAFGHREFDITQESPRERLNTTGEWLTWIQQKSDRRRNTDMDADWVNKIKSIPVYLQTKFPGAALKGLDGVLGSDLPSAMGLSSSSAMVVAMMEAMTEINGITLNDDEFVNFCGEAEWYVGTRGGSGDHAAIKCSRPGMITHMKTVPRLRIKSYLPFPKDYRLIVFNSGIVADKSGPARQKYNEKTAIYEIGEIYIREYMKTNHADIFQNVADSRKELRDDEKKFYLVDVVEHLDNSLIFDLLEWLPERVSRDELLRQMPDQKDFLQGLFATHNEPEGGYQIRAVITYGITECERSRLLEEVAKEGNMEKMGRMMTVSHDGDRVSFKSTEDKENKQKLDPSEPLYLQCGSYDCSIPEIDEMVDLAIEAGAEGAQISGAGLGGSIMALVKTEISDRVCDRLDKEFIVVAPIRGAGHI